MSMDKSKAASTQNRAKRELLTDDEVMEKPLNTHYLFRAFSYLKPYKKEVILALLALLLSSVMSLASPKLLQMALDDYIDVGKFDGLIWIALALLATSAVSAWMLRVKINLMNISGRRALAAMRDELFIRIQNLSFDFFDTRSAGKIMMRVINDINGLLNLFSQGIVNVVSDLITLVIIIVLMLTLNVRLALVAFAALPAIVILIFWVKPHMKRAWRDVRFKSSSLNAYLHESLSGVRVTQAFVREAENASIFRDVNDTLYHTWMRASTYSALFWPTFMVVQTIGNCAIYYFGISWINAGVLTMGTLFAMTWYLGRFWDPLNTLSNIYNQMLVAMASLERIYEILDRPVVVADKPGARDISTIKGDVEFRGVTFGYDYKAGQRVLDNVSFKAPAGSTIALVGPTGAGKSTVVSLINRFYDANEGAVLIDSQDVRDVTLRSLRSQVGVMLQDSFIFSGTVMDNIRYGKLDATDEEIIAAAKAVHAHEFIMQMERGYNTEVNERGSRLSTGQKQLISFARTLLADPRILILDEATASIDTHTEILIQQAIETILRGRTSFIIAHRLSTIRKADKIMVVDKGTIMEAGSHDELMRKKGIYYELCKAQYNFIDPQYKGEAKES